jgi:hypothetical protein
MLQTSRYCVLPNIQLQLLPFQLLELCSDAPLPVVLGPPDAFVLTPSGQTPVAIVLSHAASQFPFPSSLQF